jgi:hypothetical protein
MATDEAREAAWEAFRASQFGGYESVQAAVDAVRPIFIAEGRRQAAEAIRAVNVQMVADLEGDSAHVGLTVAARIAAGD